MLDTQVLKALGALSHPVRLQVFRALVVVGRQGLTPGAIIDALCLNAATLSFHLKELMEAGLVTQQRLGRNFVYRADYEQMNGVIGYLTKNCCRGDACEVETGNDSCAC